MIEGISPMMGHYLALKEKYKDCIVFYRLGDFYEMFFEDAIKASEILEITLTGRDCGKGNRAPMCGVPFHAADEYIAKLVSAGEKVAICEQLSKPTGKAKDIVERDVIKIITAGTVTNTDLIDDKSNNFLASVCMLSKSASLSWADITTGEFFTKNYYDSNYLTQIFDDLVKINPAEIIGNQKTQEILNSSPLVMQKVLPKVNYFADSEFELSLAKRVLENHLGVMNLSPFGIKDTDVCLCSAGALISYFKSTQRGVLANINSIKLEGKNEYMMLDYTAVRNLELIRTIRDNKKYGTLLWVLDKTVTSMGARKLQSLILSPLGDKDAINYRLDGVDYFYNATAIRASLKELLKSVKDIRRITGKISNGNLMPKDCISLVRSLEVMPNIKFQLLGSNSKFVNDIIAEISEFNEVISLIKNAVYDESEEELNERKLKKKEVKFIKDGYSEELDECRKLSGHGKTVLAEIEAREKERTGIKNLRVAYNKVFGYFIEVTNSFKDKVPYDYIRRQTLTNCERFITQELKELEEKLFNAEERAQVLEQKLYAEIKTFLLKYIDPLQETSNAIADLDVLLSLATVAKENGYVKPNILDADKRLMITEGRHPVVEKVSKQHFIPNDCLLDNGENLAMIITGPNMAGKSTYMRQVALITIMAHIGSFVPAKEADITLTDRVFTRIGASDNLIFNQSTFMVEMGEMASILKNATSKSLLILDEIGRGTSTFDGLSIAWAVMEYIAETLKAKTLFATHYHELTRLEELTKGVKNYKFTVKELQGEIIFLRNIIRGCANRSFGIEVAELAGVDKFITDKAKQILKKLEKNNVTTDFVSNEKVSDKKKSLCEVEKIIKEININNVSPMQAFNILCDLYEKVSFKDE